MVQRRVPRSGRRANTTRRCARTTRGPVRQGRPARFDRPRPGREAARGHWKGSARAGVSATRSSGPKRTDDPSIAGSPPPTGTPARDTPNAIVAELPRLAVRRQGVKGRTGAHQVSPQNISRHWRDVGDRREIRREDPVRGRVGRRVWRPTGCGSGCRACGRSERGGTRRSWETGTAPRPPAGW